MKRQLLRSSSFINAAKKIVKKDHYIATEIENALELLYDDAFDSRLKTHKLKGNLKGSLACSAGFNLRIIFKIVEYKESEAILLETIGTLSCKLLLFSRGFVFRPSRKGFVTCSMSNRCYHKTI